MSELVVASADITTGVMSFSAYEAGVAATVVYDDPTTASHIKGMDARAYLLGGLFEEFAETLEFDAEPPAYSRIGMIALHGDHELLDTYRQNELELARHRKEFGDTLWYATILLQRMGISLQQAVSTPDSMPAGFAQFDRSASQEFATPQPLQPYQDAFGLFAARTADHLYRPNDLSRQTAASSARVFLGNMSWIAQNRLHTTLGDVAQANMAKLATRHRNGTIFGRGDDR